MSSKGFSSEREFIDFLEFLDALCRPSAYEITRGTDTRLKFAFSVLESSAGLIDVFRFQREEAWLSSNPYSAQIGQGMFRFNGSEVEVSDRCDSGWKYLLPSPDVICYEAVGEIPSLKELTTLVRRSKNVSERFVWKGP